LDSALRAAIARCPTRRYTTYWAARGEPGALAQELIEQRRAAVVEITDADEFFIDLQEKVRSLKELDRPHPLSTTLAVSTLKRYLAEERHRIRLHDLFADELRRVEHETRDEAFPPTGADAPSRDAMFARLARYEAICETLMAMNANAGYWGEPQHQSLLVSGIERLAARWLQGGDGGYTAWIALRQYPTVLALYSAGLGASVARRLDTLAHLFADPGVRQHNEHRPVLFVASPYEVITEGLLQPDGPRHYTPVNDHLGRALREPLREFVAVDEQWELEFDRFEYLWSIAYADLFSPDGEFRWAPVGSFGRRRRWDFRGEAGLSTEIEAEARNAGDAWPFLQGSLFGGSLERFLAMKAGLDESVGQLPWL